MIDLQLLALQKNTSIKLVFKIALPFLKSAIPFFKKNRNFLKQSWIVFQNILLCNFYVIRQNAALQDFESGVKNDKGCCAREIV
jgi:hypothetical protein